jgi:Uma2 family endonuclease
MSVVIGSGRMRISADRFQKMVETGVLTKYDRVELIEGDMIDMPPIGGPHQAVIARLTKLFVLSAGDAAIVSPGGSIRLGDYSMPQPDLLLLKAREDFYARQTPRQSDVLLLVEISDGSLAYDQGTKRTLYARYGVGEYWVIDIPGERIHVYREPNVDGYAQAEVRTFTDTVSPQRLPAIKVNVGSLFA